MGPSFHSRERGNPVFCLNYCAYPHFSGQMLDPRVHGGDSAASHRRPDFVGQRIVSLHRRLTYECPVPAGLGSRHAGDVTCRVPCSICVRSHASACGGAARPNATRDRAYRRVAEPQGLRSVTTAIPIRVDFHSPARMLAPLPVTCHPQQPTPSQGNSACAGHRPISRLFGKTKPKPS